MKNKHPLYHKRHFQLLELMVAAFILLICIAPTMRIFTSMYLSQQEMIRINQRDHLVHRVHAYITEQLYKRQIPIPIDVKQSQPIILSDPELEKLLKKYSCRFEGTLTLLKFHKPRGAEHPTAYLAQLIIQLKDTPSKISKKNEEQIANQEIAESPYKYMIYINAETQKKEEPNNISTDQEIDPETDLDSDQDTADDLDSSSQMQSSIEAKRASSKMREAPL